MDSKTVSISPSNDSIESVISKHGQSLAEDTDAKDSDTIKQLQDRLDKLESALEQVGQQSELITNFNEYVKDLKADLGAVRRTRFWLLIVALIFVTIVNAIIIFLLFYSGMFWLQDTYFKSTAFVGVLTASVVLLSVMLKGAFHSLADRQKDGMLAPNLKEGVEALKLIMGR